MLSVIWDLHNRRKSDPLRTYWFIKWRENHIFRNNVQRRPMVSYKWENQITLTGVSVLSDSLILSFYSYQIQIYMTLWTTCGGRTFKWQSSDSSITCMLGVKRKQNSRWYYLILRLWTLAFWPSDTTPKRWSSHLLCTSYILSSALGKGVFLTELPARHHTYMYILEDQNQKPSSESRKLSLQSWIQFNFQIEIPDDNWMGLGSVFQVWIRLVWE